MDRLVAVVPQDFATRWRFAVGAIDDTCTSRAKGITAMLRAEG